MNRPKEDMLYYSIIKRLHDECHKEVIHGKISIPHTVDGYTNSPSQNDIEQIFNSVKTQIEEVEEKLNDYIISVSMLQDGLNYLLERPDQFWLTKQVIQLEKNKLEEMVKKCNKNINEMIKTGKVISIELIDTLI